MKKIIFAVVIFLLIVVSYIAISRRPDPVVVLGPSDEVELTYTDAQYSESDDLISVDVHYPRFSDPAIADIVEHYAVDPAKEFYRVGRTEAEEIKEDFPDWPGRYEFITSYTVATDTDPYINIMFSRYSDTGGAHGLGFTDVLVIDREHGDRIEFADLFTNTGIAARALPALVTESLLEQKMSKLGISKEDALESLEEPFASSLSGILENYDNFSLTPEGVTFYFSPYQAGAYVEGEYSVFVPRSDLQEYLVPDFKVVPN